MKHSSFLRRCSDSFTDFRILLRSIPAPAVSLFILSVVCANLMANKELVSYKYLALDCGFAFSWIMFLCMDIICKRWGARASVKVSVFALLVNLAVCLSFAILSRTPG
ncbi:MAG: VUT family protein, partial [Treponema porcinum]|nr:VUT family protein [Treponema porcinum]